MSQIKISTKLIMLVSLMLLFILLVGFIGMLNIKTVDKTVDTIYKDRVLPLRKLDNIAAAYDVKFVGVVEQADARTITFPEALEELKGVSAIVTSNMDEYLRSSLSAEERKLADEAVELRKTSKTAYTDVIKIFAEEDNEGSRTRLDAFIRDRLYQDTKPFVMKIDQLKDLQLSIAEELSIEGNKTYSRALWLNSILMVFASIVGLSFGIFIILGIRKSLANANKVVEQMAAGNLLVEVTSDNKDEIGLFMENLSLMVSKIKEVIGQVLVGSESITNASLQLSSTSQQLSQSATEQASSVEEVSSSMEEMVSNIQQSAENSTEAEKIAEFARMGIENLSEASEKSLSSVFDIAEKIRIINDIAFQTNLLALNAAVEAARAGEHGRGFAVVASEVRKLAERSKIAADEIVGLADLSRSNTEKAMISMRKLVPEISKTSKLVQEIKAGSVEQNSGADQINSAIQQMNQLTQQNAAASEEMATNAEELSSQAERLLNQVSFFKVEEKLHIKQHVTKSTNNIRQTGKGLVKPLNKELNRNSSKLKTYRPAKGISLNLSESKDEDYEKFSSY
jgi:methyl-accepting chemotaxis protein